MGLEMLKKILAHHLDSGISIASSGANEPCINNSWVSFTSLSEDDKYLYIPVGGMSQLETNIKTLNKVCISLTNREITGAMYHGTGVIVEGSVEFLYEGEIFETMKEKFEWQRASLKVTITKVKQTL